MPTNSINKFLLMDDDLPEPSPISKYKGTYFTMINTSNKNTINTLYDKELMPEIWVSTRLIKKIAINNLNILK
jgi:hypothetical protein